MNARIVSSSHGQAFCGLPVAPGERLRQSGFRGTIRRLSSDAHGSNCYVTIA
jgi:hypothetical protein